MHCLRPPTRVHNPSYAILPRFAFLTLLVHNKCTAAAGDASLILLMLAMRGISAQL